MTSKEAFEKMKRLTKNKDETKNWQYLTNGGQLVDKKLSQLEDIEEELGIDLITLFKALKNGIYGKVGNEIEYILAPHLSWYNREIYIFKIKDYGKTWALTTEELENEKEN